MNEKITDWLLEGPSWLRFAVETQLLGLESDVQAALQDDSIRKIIDRLKDARIGIPGIKTGKVTWENTGNAYWDLFFLTDIGLDAKEMDLEPEIEEFFELQLPDGTFITEDHHPPKYFCVSGIFLASVARAGYKDDPRIRKLVEFLLNAQQSDGWHCGDNHTGGKYQGNEACPMDNLNILQLLGQYERFRRDSRFNGAADLLLEHWERREEGWRPSDFGIGKRFKALEYPAVKYGILRVLDVVSLFPHAFENPSFKNMLDFVRKKSVDGRYFAESVPDAYSEFDFGQMSDPSRWLTFTVTRIEKRAKEFGQE